MTDFEAFQTALRKGEDDELRQGGGGGSGYMGNLLNSMSLMLEEFYKHLSLVGVSAMAGTGIDDFLAAVQEKVVEYESEYRPELEKMRKKREEEKVAKQQKELDKLMKDMQVDQAVQPSAGSSGSGTSKLEPVQVDVLSDFDSDEEGGEMIERDEDEEPRKIGNEEGLQARYQQALAEDREKGPQGQGTLDEESFVRYLMANK